MFLIYLYYVVVQQLAPPVRTTLLSAVPVIPRPVAPVVRLASGQMLTSMPPMMPAPRINVVPMPPSAPHIMTPRPPPMVVPTGKMKVSKPLRTVTIEYLNTLL